MQNVEKNEREEEIISRIIRFLALCITSFRYVSSSLRLNCMNSFDIVVVCHKLNFLSSSVSLGTAFCFLTHPARTWTQNPKRDRFPKSFEWTFIQIDKRDKKVTTNDVKIISRASLTVALLTSLNDFLGFLHLNGARERRCQGGKFKWSKLFPLKKLQNSRLKVSRWTTKVQIEKSQLLTCPPKY